MVSDLEVMECDLEVRPKEPFFLISCFCSECFLTAKENKQVCYLQNHLARPCHVIWPNFSVLSTSLLNTLTRILLDSLVSINIKKMQGLV